MELSEPKQILYVSPFNEPISGADESLLLVISHLDRKKFLPIILLPKDSNYIERYQKAGAEVHFWELSRLRRTVNPLYWLEYLQNLRNEIRLLPYYLLGKEIRLVHLNMHVALGPAIGAKRSGIPVVTHYRAKTNDRPKLFFNWFLPKLHRYSNVILCISRQLIKHFESRNLKEHVQLLYNPIDFQRFESQKHSPQKNKTILFVGRITPQKQIHIFLKALRILREKGEDVQGIIMGDIAKEDFSYALKLKTLAKGLPVEWVTGRKDVETFFAKADVFAFPAINEGFGRVLVEAMISGVPIVGVNSGATPEILADGKYGVITDPKNEMKFADGIQKALHDSQFQDKAKEAKLYAKENFSVHTHVHKLMEIYGKLIG